MNYDFANEALMEKVKMTLDEVQLPKIVKVKQYFPDQKLENVHDVLLERLNKLNPEIKPGERIAITAGSRGIGSFLEMEQAAVEFVKSKGGIPFIVPAMGSHGGATAEGQKDLLKGYGITEEAVGCPIISSMEVDEIGVTPAGLPVYIDRNAHEADGIILLNRIKTHTTFEGKYESGLFKMLAIGLAKHKGALMTHRLTFDNMAKNVEDVGLIGLKNLNIRCGIGSIENGYGEVADVFVLSVPEIIEKEPEILEQSKKLMAGFAPEEFDGLVVQEIGKEISGSGMDTNIIGRYGVPFKHGGPVVKRIAVLDVTDKSHGNTIGMGYGDFISRRMADKIAFKDVYINAMTTLNPKAALMPMVLPTDEYVVKMILKCAGKLNYDDISMVFVKNTHEMDYVYMTEAAIKAIPSGKKYEVIGEYMDIPFDKDGNLKLF